jgi:hypothetical protein
MSKFIVTGAFREKLAHLHCEVETEEEAVFKWWQLFKKEFPTAKKDEIMLYWGVRAVGADKGQVLERYWQYDGYWSRP